LQLCACILSAAARDVSFCRKDQWKIHRMAPIRRSVFRKSAWRAFGARFDYVLSEVRRCGRVTGTCKYYNGSLTTLIDRLSRRHEGTFDVAITSPPYGDSQTTVQYGGMSSLCLGVLRHLKDLDIPFMSSAEIDNRCLGGTSQHSELTGVELTPFWPGPKEVAGDRVGNFLRDIRASCESIVRMLKKRGTAVFVVARRNVEGHSLKLDRFLIHSMLEIGCSLTATRTREIVGKMTPYLIDSRGHTREARPSARAYTATMRKEYVLVFHKSRATSRTVSFGATHSHRVVC